MCLLYIDYIFEHDCGRQHATAKNRVRPHMRSLRSFSDRKPTAQKHIKAMILLNILVRECDRKPTANRPHDLRDVSAFRGSRDVSLRTYYVGPYGSWTPPPGVRPGCRALLASGGRGAPASPLPPNPPATRLRLAKSPCRGLRLRRRR